MQAQTKTASKTSQLDPSFSRVLKFFGGGNLMLYLFNMFVPNPEIGLDYIVLTDVISIIIYVLLYRRSKRWANRVIFFQLTFVNSAVVYFSNEMYFMFCGWIVSTPLYILFFTDEYNLSLLSSLCYCFIPFIYKNNITSNAAALTADQEAYKILLQDVINLIVISSTIRHFFNIMKKSESEALKALKEAKLAQQKLESFLDSFSHELRNPLNSIKGNIELALKEPQLSETMIDYLNTSRTCTELQLQMVNNILDSGKSNQGKLEIVPRPTCIRKLVQNIWEIFNTIIKSKGLNGVVYFDSKIPQFLSLDQIRLTQVIMNLLSNAIKFTQTGSIILKVDWMHGANQINEKFFTPDLSIREASSSHEIPEEVTLDSKDVNRDFFENQTMSGYEILNLEKKGFTKPAPVQSRGEQGVLRISIRDTGKGISSEDLHDLFQKFKQFSADTTDRQIGTGLGLFITKEIVDKSKGEIKAFSRLESGTQFVVCIPTSFEPDFNLQDGHFENIVQNLKQKQPRILLIDNQIFNLNIMKQFVETCGGKVVGSFYNVNEALQFYKSHNLALQIQIVIMNVEMQLINSFEMGKKIRKIEEEQNWQKSNLFALSSKPFGNDQAMKDSNFNSFMQKPLRYDEFVKEIWKLAQ